MGSLGWAWLALLPPSSLRPVLHYVGLGALRKAGCSVEQAPNGEVAAVLVDSSCLETCERSARASAIHPVDWHSLGPKCADSQGGRRPGFRLPTPPLRASAH